MFITTANSNLTHKNYIHNKVCCAP